MNAPTITECKRCTYWHYVLSRSEVSDTERHECQRRSPSAEIAGRVWPWTEGRDWCGDGYPCDDNGSPIPGEKGSS